MKFIRLYESFNNKIVVEFELYGRINRITDEELCLLSKSKGTVIEFLRFYQEVQIYKKLKARL